MNPENQEYQFNEPINSDLVRTQYFGNLLRERLKRISRNLGLEVRNAKQAFIEKYSAVANDPKYGNLKEILTALPDASMNALVSTRYGNFVLTSKDANVEEYKIEQNNGDLFELMNYFAIEKENGKTTSEILANASKSPRLQKIMEEGKIEELFRKYNNSFLADEMIYISGKDQPWCVFEGDPEYEALMELRNTMDGLYEKTIANQKAAKTNGITDAMSRAYEKYFDYFENHLSTDISSEDYTKAYDIFAMLPLCTKESGVLVLPDGTSLKDNVNYELFNRVYDMMYANMDLCPNNVPLDKKVIQKAVADIKEAKVVNNGATPIKVRADQVDKITVNENQTVSVSDVRDYIASLSKEKQQEILDRVEEFNKKHKRVYKAFTETYDKKEHHSPFFHRRAVKGLKLYTNHDLARVATGEIFSGINSDQSQYIADEILVKLVAEAKKLKITQEAKKQITPASEVTPKVDSEEKVEEPIAQPSNITPADEVTPEVDPEEKIEESTIQPTNSTPAEHVVPENSEVADKFKGYSDEEILKMVKDGTILSVFSDDEIRKEGYTRKSKASMDKYMITQILTNAKLNYSDDPKKLSDYLKKNGLDELDYKFGRKLTEEERKEREDFIDLASYHTGPSRYEMLKGLPGRENNKWKVTNEEVEAYLKSKEPEKKTKKKKSTNSSKDKQIAKLQSQVNDLTASLKEMRKYIEEAKKNNNDLNTDEMDQMMSVLTAAIEEKDGKSR